MLKSRSLQVAAIALALLAGLAEIPSVASEDFMKTVEQAASDAATAVKNAVSPPPQTFSEKLKDAWKGASETVSGYADKISAQLPKRAKRESGASQAGADLRRSSTGPADGGSSPFDEKLDSARQLVQKIRGRCVSGLDHEASDVVMEQRRNSQERSSSSGSLGKLDELTDKVKNKTSDAREVLKKIREKCAEILSNKRQPEQVSGARSRREAPSGAQSAAASPEKQQAPPSPVATLFSNGQVALAKFGDQVREQTATAVQNFQNFRDQLVAKPRERRQIQYPKLEQAQQQDPQAQQPASSPMNSAMKYISDLGQQAQQAQAISQFVQAATQQAGASPANSPASSTSSNVAQVLTQLTDLIKSTQNRNERLLESGQRNLEAANQQTMEVAKSAQTGVQAALSDLTSGLQRLASNNPNLVPDIKSLYQSVSSKLSSSSSAVPPASGPNQSPAVPAVPAVPAA